MTKQLAEEYRKEAIPSGDKDPEAWTDDDIETAYMAGWETLLKMNPTTINEVLAKQAETNINLLKQKAELIKTIEFYSTANEDLGIFGRGCAWDDDLGKRAREVLGK